MSIIRRAIAPPSERRAASGSQLWGPPTEPPPPGWGGGASAGMSVSQQSTFGIAAVYGAVGILSDAVSTLPIRVMSSPALSTARVLAPTPLITQPYSEISRIDWFVQFVSALALRGNFYGRIIERDDDLYASQIKPIPADNARVRRLPSGELEYRFYNDVVPIDDVFHVKNITMPGMLVGLNPIECLRMTFAMALAQEAYGESFFRNSATPSGILNVEGELPPTETKALLQSWLAAHQGSNNWNLPAVLTDGVTFQPVMMTPEDSQFLQSRQFSASQVASLFRIPPHMLSQVDRTTSWGTGIEQQERGFVQNTLQGYLARAEESLTALHPPGQFVSFDIEHRVQGDTLQRAQAGSLMMLAGAWCADDVRARFQMPPVPDGKGQEFYVPINTELLQAALAQVQAAQAAENQPPPVVGDGGPNG